MLVKNCGFLHNFSGKPYSNANRYFIDFIATLHSYSAFVNGEISKYLLWKLLFLIYMHLRHIQVKKKDIIFYVRVCLDLWSFSRKQINLSD